VKKLILLFALLALFIVNGCGATSGTRQIQDETRASIESKITKGTTTKEDVRAMFGDPIMSHFTDSGNEEWQYYFSKNKVKATSFIPVVGAFKSGMNEDRKTLVILFDQNGVVMNFSMQNFQNDIRGGIVK
jgi:outer membrane protein assembly factor BamE (lipoprotein component of BamABCDE complex)